MKPHDSAHLALIIDDEPAIRTALRRFFSRKGWSVEEASDGAAGLALLAQYGNEIDMVISDLRMPGFSGIRLHDQLVEEHSDLLARIIFTTGDVVSGEAAGFVSRTQCTVLQKPFELGTLDQIITRLQTAQLRSA